jgi:hypothetical protein
MSAGLQDSIFNLFVYGPNGLIKINSREPFGKPCSTTRVNRPTNDAGRVASDKYGRQRISRVAHLSPAHSKVGVDEALELLERAQDAIVSIRDKLAQLQNMIPDTNYSEKGATEEQKDLYYTLVNEIDDIARETNYKDMHLLDGSLVTGVGSGFWEFNGNEMLIRIESARISRLGMVTGDSSLKEVRKGGLADVSTTAGAKKAAHIVKNALAHIDMIHYDINSYRTMLRELREPGNKVDWRETVFSALV